MEFSVEVLEILKECREKDSSPKGTKNDKFPPTNMYLYFIGLTFLH